MKGPLQLLNVEVRAEQDVVLARQRARQVADLLGFDLQGQTRIGTAVSEIVRNAFRYANSCKVTFRFDMGHLRRLIITVADQGPGIANLEAILSGQYRSKTGMGMGLLGTRRIMDRVEITTAPDQGTTVTMSKFLPQKAPALGSSEFARISTALAQGIPGDPLGEVQQQNQELLAVLGELSQRQGELVAVNKELEDTNRGVVALYAELDARADFLRKATEVKSRFLSNMTHEFRTPLNSIIALAHMLLDRTDGELAAEQERQATFILRSAQELTALVNDLLDVAKVDAGKVGVRPADFAIGDLFGALKGMLRPLLSPNSTVTLNFSEPSDALRIHSDEGKVSQILRNLISNALKFTVNGEVRVDAAPRPNGGIVFTVSDTGIGISAENLPLIFEEFGQVETHIQPRFKGTGLGLPLSKRLAELLGGELRVSSIPGSGSTFRLILPPRYSGNDSEDLVGTSQHAEPSRYTRQAMVIDDDDVARYLIRGLLPKSFEVNEVGVIADGLTAATQLLPDIIFLNIHMGNIGGLELLRMLKQSQSTCAIPLVAYSPRGIDAQTRAVCSGADAVLELGAGAQTSLIAMRQLLAGIGLIVAEKES